MVCAFVVAVTCNDHDVKACHINQRTLKCKSCYKGHVEKICIMKLLNNHTESAEAYNFYHIINIYKKQFFRFQDSQKYFVNVKIENKLQHFEVDSGAMDWQLWLSLIHI